MAKIRIVPEILSDRLFGGSEYPVKIMAARFDPFTEVVELMIEGPDIPDADEVRAIITVTQNRVGERIHTIKFEPAA